MSNSKEVQPAPAENPQPATGHNAPTKVEVMPTENSRELSTFDDIANAVENGKALGDLKVMKVGTINMKTEYKSFEEKGEVIRRVFAGMTLRQSIDPVTGEDKGLQPAVMLYDPETETINVCMQSVLVGVIQEVGYPRGQALQITYKGEKKSSKGTKYQDFDIRALIPSK